MAINYEEYLKRKNREELAFEFVQDFHDVGTAIKLSKKFDHYIPSLKIRDEMQFAGKKSPMIGINEDYSTDGCLIEILRARKRGPKKGQRYHPHVYFATGDQIEGGSLHPWKGVNLHWVEISKLEVVIEREVNEEKT